MKIENNRKIVRIKSLFLVLALVVGMLGSCFTVSASSNKMVVGSLLNGGYLQGGNTYHITIDKRDYYYGQLFEVSNLVSSSDVYFYWACGDVDEKFCLCSKDPFEADFRKVSDTSDEFLDYKTLDFGVTTTTHCTSSKATYSGETFYYMPLMNGTHEAISSGYYTPVLSSNPVNDYDAFNKSIKYMSYLAVTQQADLYIEGGGFSYSDFVSDDIEDVLGLLLNPYTGREDNQTAYLWKWTPPVDTTLLMEISADVEYTDSLTDSLLTAIKNSWSTKHVSLFTYEDEILGSNGSIKFTYDYVKEKVAEEIGEEPQKIRLKNVYFRYAKIDEEESVVNYGNYTTFTPNYKSYMDVLPEVGVVTYPTGNHHSGVTENYDPKTDTIPETNVNISTPSDPQGVEDFFGSVLSYLKSGTTFLDEFPLIMRDIFVSIPSPIMVMITTGVGLLIVLRIFGR